MTTHSLAPIGVSTYRRLVHLQKCITALQQNHLASRSHLFIFSDAPQTGDEESVAQVREFARGITGFARIEIVERSSNSRTYNNRQGIRRLLNEYGRIIWLEEDIVTAPYFLPYMNEALDFYSNDQTVMSISGYTPPIKIPRSYRHDVFALMRFNAWGFGMWKDRFDKLKLTVEGYGKFVADKGAVARFASNGEDLPLMLAREAAGETDAWDVKIMYEQFLSSTTTIYPVRSLTNNIGHDGTGVHCVNTRKFNVDLSKAPRKITFEPNLRPDREILALNYAFRMPAKPKFRAKHILKRLYGSFGFLLRKASKRPDSL